MFEDFEVKSDQPEESNTSDISPDEDKKKEEIRRAGRERKRAFDQRKKEAALAESWKADSKHTPSKPDAMKLLEARGITPGHILNTVYDLAMVACEQNKLIPNRFYFNHGLRQTIKSTEAGKAVPLEPVEDIEIAGELVRQRDLYALWDYEVSWRPGRLTFREFLNTRRACKTDLIKFGSDVLGKDFHELPHRAWADLLPKFNPDTLRPGYSQEDMKRALGAVSECKKRLLIASRNSYKSSVAGVWLLQAVLFCPDLRALYVSETKPLSRAMIRGFRSYWERKPGTPTKFNQLFPEMMIAPESGSELTFQSPMAHLDLIQATAESTSMDSTVAGNRADVIIFDDPISNVTVGNETQRNASVEKFDLLLKLLEVGSLGSITLGTPWHQEDLYATLLKRNDDDEDKPLLFKIDPAFTVKDEFKKKAKTDEGLLSLTEDQVTLLFPSRLTWKFLKSEMSANKKNLRIFRMQNLCEFVPEEDDLLRCTFTEDDLRRRVRLASYFDQFPKVDTVAAIDTAFSVSKYADMSCICVADLRKDGNKTIIVVKDVILDRLKQSELAVTIVEAIHKHSPSRVLIEKIGPWQTLADFIRNAAMQRSYLLPHIFWKSTHLGGTTPRLKATRVKALEPLLDNGQLWFANGHWNDDALAQLCKFDGLHASNSHRKDDFPDSLAMLAEAYLPQPGFNEKSEDALKAEDDAAAAEMRALHYQQVFGTSSTRPIPQPEQSTRGTVYGIPGIRVRSSDAPPRKIGTFTDVMPRRNS